MKTRHTWSPKLVSPYESLWLILHKYALLNYIKTKQMYERFNVSSLKSQPPMWYEGFIKIQRNWSIDVMRDILELPVEQIQNSVVLNHAPQVGRFSIENKFCMICLKKGFHTPLFNFSFIQNCPLHNIPLSTKCSRCASHWLPTLISPCACRQCGYRWFNAANVEIISSDEEATLSSYYSILHRHHRDERLRFYAMSAKPKNGSFNGEPTFEDLVNLFSPWQERCCSVFKDPVTPAKAFTYDLGFPLNINQFPVEPEVRDSLFSQETLVPYDFRKIDLEAVERTLCMFTWKLYSDVLFQITKHHTFCSGLNFEASRMLGKSYPSLCPIVKVVEQWKEKWRFSLLRSRSAENVIVQNWSPKYIEDTFPELTKALACIIADPLDAVQKTKLYNLAVWYGSQYIRQSILTDLKLSLCDPKNSPDLPRYSRIDSYPVPSTARFLLLEAISNEVRIYVWNPSSEREIMPLLQASRDHKKKMKSSVQAIEALHNDYTAKVIKLTSGIYDELRKLLPEHLQKLEDFPDCVH